MILAFSTSSPFTSIAVVDGDSNRFTGAVEAPRASSGALISLLKESGVSLTSLTAIAIDLGPGSFTGVRVGVTMAKIWAAELGIPVYCVTAFDLVNIDLPVALPSRRGEVFLRDPGHEPRIAQADDLPVGTVGSGVGGDHPDARKFAECRHLWLESDPYELLPFYLAEPAISQPKQKHIMGETFRNV